MEDGRERGGDDAWHPKLLDEEQFSAEVSQIAHQISSADIFIFACLLLLHGNRVRVFADSWVQIFVVLASGINTTYILGYSGTIMVDLGWVAGAVGLLMGNILSLYANILVVELHELGGRRHIRYRDLAGCLYGKKGYIIIWALQYVMLFLINLGYIILGGSALKAVYVSFRDDNNIKLPYFIAIAGFVCFMFAILVPHLSVLRVWLGVSTILALIHVTIAIMYCIKDGANAPAKDYSISGTFASKLFTTIGAIANLFFPFNTGMILEIQNPVVSNMMKALYAQFTVGVLPLFAVAFAGYWAYGSSTSAYLLKSISGPAWLKTLANISAFLQAVIAFHIFANPTYEYLDTKYGIQGSPLAIRNLSFRIGVRGGYLIISTMVSALLPFLGDFMSLAGAICTIPVTFIIPNHMCLVAKARNLTPLQKLWHWVNICCFGCLSIAAAVAALRLIAVDSKTYHVFADLW